MNRGPSRATNSVDHVARAKAAWDPAPEWVIVLAEACCLTSQSKVGSRIKYSPATVSQILSNTYRGDIRRVEEMVRGALMSETVECPQLGEMSRARCLDWQKKPFAPSSSHRVAMYRACRNNCPHSRIKGGDDA